MLFHTHPSNVACGGVGDWRRCVGKYSSRRRKTGAPKPLNARLALFCVLHAGTCSHIQ